MEEGTGLGVSVRVADGTAGTVLVKVMVALETAVRVLEGVKLAVELEFPGVVVLTVKSTVVDGEGDAARPGNVEGRLAGWVGSRELAVAERLLSPGVEISPS